MGRLTSEPNDLSGPIGVLDSGVGGLSILRALQQELPNESLVYVADQAHLPYGPRPSTEIRGFIHAITDFLLGQRAKIIVVACNAASAAGLLYLRETFPTVSFVGMEPAVKPAAAATASGIIGVLTTAATANGPLYARVLARFAGDAQVKTVVCPELVIAVENNRISAHDLQPLFEQRLSPLRAAGVDQLVLGCTHFPFATDAIQRFMGTSVAIVDPSSAIARQARRILTDSDRLNEGATTPTVQAYTTGDPARFTHLSESLLGSALPTAGLQWVDGTIAPANAPAA